MLQSIGRTQTLHQLKGYAVWGPCRQGIWEKARRVKGNVIIYISNNCLAQVKISCCAGKKHTFVATRNKPVCGCIGPGFIQNAKRNHYCTLVQAGNSPEKYRETILTLGKYHSRDIHEWEGGSCSLHPLTKCSCKECEADENGFYPDMKCQGQPYRSAHPLKYEFHGLMR